MIRHLQDRMLLGMLEGEGSPREHEHLRSCAACATRRARLVRDMEILSSVLGDGPLPRPVARPISVSSRRWAVVAAFAAAAVALAWRLTALTPLPVRVASADAPSLQTLAAAVFATDDVEQLTKPVRSANLAAVQAALRGEWPCARHDPWLDQDCD